MSEELGYLRGLERRLSDGHVQALAAWVRSEPIAAGSPPAPWILRRFFLQLCGRALQHGDGADLDLALRACLRGGAWVGDRMGDREWFHLSFVWFSARHVGYDAEGRLRQLTDELEPGDRDRLLDIVPALDRFEEPMDPRSDRYVAVVVGDHVDFEGRWDPDRHQRWLDWAVRRQEMAQRAAGARRAGGDAAGADRFLDTLDEQDLPWLPAGVPVYAPPDRLDPDVETRLVAWAVADDPTEPPATPDQTGEFVRHQASTAARHGDRSALAMALTTAARAAPRLLGLPFRAADHVLGADADRWLPTQAERLDERARDEVHRWVQNPDRSTDLAGHVETGLLGGLMFSRRFDGG